jgi:hypothetical protein
MNRVQAYLGPEDQRIRMRPFLEGTRTFLASASEVRPSWIGLATLLLAVQALVWSPGIRIPLALSLVGGVLIFGSINWRYARRSLRDGTRRPDRSEPGGHGTAGT